MVRKTLAVLGAGCLVWGLTPVQYAAAPGASQGGQTPVQVQGSDHKTGPARELVTTYCVSCHNPKLKAGNFVINPADADNVAGSPETWEKVVVKLRSRAMPPQRSRRPDASHDEVLESAGASSLLSGPGDPAAMSSGISCAG